MASPRSLLAIVVSSVALVAALVVTAFDPSSATAPSIQPAYARSIDAAPGTALRGGVLARAAATSRGGPITTSTGETVNVLVSDALPIETSTPEGWAEFLTGLTHGPEITLLTAHITTLDEVQDICGSRALGCYTLAPASLARGRGPSIATRCLGHVLAMCIRPVSPHRGTSLRGFRRRVKG